MIENILEQSVLKNGHEISFMLGHRILSKSGQEWIEVKGGELSMSEWEDLKDLCLVGNEKVQLETKGFVVGVHESKKHKWKFSFIERKDCYRAHLSLLKAQELIQSQIENPHFWDAVRKEKGLFIITGEKRQGKTSLLQEVIENDQKHKLSLVGIHSAVQNSNWPQIDSVVHLGVDTLEFDAHHVIYEGLERIVVDTNSVKNWAKWVDLAEQGQSVFISVAANSVSTLLNKLMSELETSLCRRLFSVLNGVISQKLVGSQYQPCSEILIVRDAQRPVAQGYLSVKSVSAQNLQDDFKETYQSLNQSIIQKMVRRKIDVKSAFEASDNPDQLDVTLKKMGL